MWKQEREKKEMFIGVMRHEGGLFSAKRLAKRKIAQNHMAGKGIVGRKVGRR